MSYSSDRELAVDRIAQSSRFKPWTFIVVPILAILFQIYVPLFLPFLGYLELPLIVTIYFSLMRRSQIRGLFIGAMVGLAQDSLSNLPLGTFGICKTLVGYFSASIGMQFDVEHAFVRLILCFIFYLFHQFFYWLLQRSLLDQPAVFQIQKELLLAVVNAMIGVVLFHFLDKLRKRE